MIRAKIIIFDDATGKELESKTTDKEFYIDRRVDYPEVKVRDYIFFIDGGPILGDTGAWRNNNIFGELHYMIKRSE